MRHVNQATSVGSRMRRLASGRLDGRGHVVPLIAIIFLAVTQPATVSATNWGSLGTPGISGTTNGVWLTPNNTWHIGRRALTAAHNTGVINSANDDYGPTDLVVSVSSASSCPDADWDQCVFDSDYGNNGLVGWNQCAGSTNGSHPNQVCTLGFTKINLHYSSWTPAEVACHELGHSIGLREGTALAGSCMRDPAESGILLQHDRNHINNHYPP